MIMLDIFQTNATSNRIHYKEEKVIKIKCTLLL